jgi:hypothetical protein
MLKPDVNTFSSLISKYGFDKVSRANQVEVLSSGSDNPLEN